MMKLAKDIFELNRVSRTGRRTSRNRLEKFSLKYP